ncbi:MAG: recombinase family protein [Oscillospiraceae bacterium]|nr:recombinase family protein [Oscillospiraceae bacterium]
MKKTRYIPYGYTVRNGHTVIDHAEAEIIRQIFEEYTKGASLKELASELTARKVPYTERTIDWDKARIARILENGRYIGDDGYDPIIEDALYYEAIATKAARQSCQTRQESAAITLLRNRVRCDACGSVMNRRVCSKSYVKQSWVCTNLECGCRVRISDMDLLMKVTVIMNRIIRNASLMLPKQKAKRSDSPAVTHLRQELQCELERENPSEEYILEKIRDVASQLYREEQTKEQVAARIALHRVQMMHPQDTFNCAYFSDLVSYITLNSQGDVTLHTKTNTDVTTEE